MGQSSLALIAGFSARSPTYPEAGCINTPNVKPSALTKVMASSSTIAKVRGSFTRQLGERPKPQCSLGPSALSEDSERTKPEAITRVTPLPSRPIS